jgi:hypothetical protein
MASRVLVTRRFRGRPHSTASGIAANDSSASLNSTRFPCVVRQEDIIMFAGGCGPIDSPKTKSLVGFETGFETELGSSQLLRQSCGILSQLG